MTRYWAVLPMLLLALVVAVAWPATARASTGAPDSSLDEEADWGILLVGVEPGLSEEAVAAQLAQVGLELEQYWPRMALAAGVPLAGEASAASMFGLAQSNYAESTFRYVSPNQRIYAADALAQLPEPPLVEPQPNDARFSEQWAPPIVKAVDAWNISHGSPQVVVAVIDSGYDVGHPDIDPAQIWTNEAEANGVPGVDDDGNGFIDDISGWDWVDDDNLPDDPFGHGTHVLGIIAAATNNQLGIAGIGGTVRVAPLRVLDSAGRGELYTLVDVIDYAVEQEMHVLNLSLITLGDNPAVRDAVQAAYAAGLSIIASAGNDAYERAYWPAEYPETVAVAATDYLDRRALFSNYGSAIELAAPGSSVLSLHTAGGYRSLSGTSMAAPHVSALFALLRSLRPDLSHAQLLEIANSTADDVNADSYPGTDVYLGAGRINVYRALLHASADLALQPDAIEIAPLGEPVNLQLRVQTQSADSGATPVQGAVAYARVVSASAEAEVDASLERVLTDANGVAAFTIDTPEQPGDYVIRLQVGAAVVDWPLAILDPPAVIRTAVQTQTLTVGDASTPFTVRLLDAEGSLLSGETPLHLETTAGEFADAQTAFSAVAQDGIYSGTLYAGTVAGTGRLIVSVGEARRSTPVTVLADVPASVQLVNTARQTDAVNTRFDFEALVLDRYGNSVDGAGVSAVATAGVLSPPSALVAQAGIASFDLTVPNNRTETISVTVELPGYGFSDSLEVRATRIWLPSTQK